MDEIISNDEFEEHIEEVKGDVTQADSIDESVSQHMGEMGFLWNQVQQKLHKDGICFHCKSEINFDKNEPVQLLEATGVERGVVAFVSICKKCIKELQEVQNAESKRTKDKK